MRDNDPALFWTYLVAALRTAAPGVDASALSLLQSSQPPTEAMLAALLNDLHAVPHEIVLVLDDYHVIDAREVQDAMAFLLEHLPPQLHLVIASRADVAALESRTEGWIVALQLVALSMQGRSDVAGFIAGFAGDDRYIVDYLAEEVLQRQPEQVRSFLLHTCVLSRLNGSLCDAVTGNSGNSGNSGKAMLEALDRGNLFLVPLDDRRQWYRYHHLFADVLRARLLDSRPDLVAELHRRASHWYEQNGERSEAIRHAMAGEDYERAADLVELAIPALRRGRQDATLCGWLEALPDELSYLREYEHITLARLLLAQHTTQRAEHALHEATQLLERLLKAAEQGRRTGSVLEVLVLGDRCSVRPHRAGLRAADHRGGAGILLGVVTRHLPHGEGVQAFGHCGRHQR